MMSRDEHKKLLRDADESVLPRREDETDGEYGKRMHEHLNGRPPTLAESLASEQRELHRRMVHHTAPKGPLSLSEAIALHKKMG